MGETGEGLQWTTMGRAVSTGPFKVSPSQKMRKDAFKTTFIVGMEASFSCNVHIDAGDSKLKNDVKQK